MPDFLSLHQETLSEAVEAITSRRYWSPYPEQPKAYGDEAAEAGRAAFEARLGRPFAIDQPARGFFEPAESSPYGIDLGITYPASDPASLIAAARAAMGAWGRATPGVRAGVLLEILQRLAAQSFEMAAAVMHTTGQSFLMAFQAGGPHALDRALEAVAYAYVEQTRLPGPMTWEKPQGSRDPLVVEKEWIVRPRGVAVAIGVSTFPTWNGYPGIFASLGTGNAVIVKPHPTTILPFAIFVETARTVIAEAGFDPNVVTLAADTPDAPVAVQLVSDPAVAIVDYTGGPSFGNWLEENVHQASVYTEKAGVNSVIIDSARDLAPVFQNLSVSMTMYSGQMCTTPQNVYISRAGVAVDGEIVPFADVAAGLASAIDGLLADDARAVAVLGAIKARETIDRIASAAGRGTVLLESRAVRNPEFPDAVVRTPVVVQVDGHDRAAYMAEMFGPVIFVIATDSTEHSLDLAAESARAKGAITWLLYAVDEAVIGAAVDAAVDAGVSLAVNLTGGLYVNQSAAFSDFHVTGANPAGNASLTDPAFVANRFRVVGVRRQHA
ncbi:MAG: phenylacetic acid degradation protein PaaN [Actinobacteria bacterium]|nr:MAG: phenylacetic acid degradation protein PaaN [Actinomycetota bacterium]